MKVVEVTLGCSTNGWHFPLTVPKHLSSLSTLTDPFLPPAWCVQVVRPQRWYTQLIDALPTVFIGPPRQLAALIDFMAVRMEESFRACGMTSPPWRQKTSLLARWELTLSAASASYAQLPAATFSSPRPSGAPHPNANANTRNATPTNAPNTAVLFRPSPTAVSPAALCTATPTRPYNYTTTAPPPAQQQHAIKLLPVVLAPPPAAAAHEHHEPLTTSSTASPRATAAVAESVPSSCPTTASELHEGTKQQRRIALATLARAPIPTHNNRFLHPQTKSSPSTAQEAASVRLLSRGVVKRRTSMAHVDVYGVVAAREAQARGAVMPKSLKCV